MLAIQTFVRLIVLVTLLLSLAPSVYADDPTVQPELNFRVFLPIVSQGESNQRSFEWRLAEDQVSAASVNSINDFGREWIQRQLDYCAIVDSQGGSEQEKYDCEMLKHTMAGELTDEDLTKIRENGGYLILVFEGSLEVSDDMVSTAALKQGTAKHPITGETLYATVEGVFWDAKFRHKTWAGVEQSGYSQYIVDMKGVAKGSVSYNQSWPTRYWSDYYPEQKGHSVVWGKKGYSVYTEGCFKASNGRQEARICVNSGSLTY